MGKKTKTLYRKTIHPRNIHIRVREDQAETWRAAAQAKGIDLSEWMRMVLDREARK